MIKNFISITLSILVSWSIITLFLRPLYWEYEANKMIVKLEKMDKKNKEKYIAKEKRKKEMILKRNSGSYRIFNDKGIFKGKVDRRDYQ